MDIRKSYQLEGAQILSSISVVIVGGGLLPAIAVLIFFNITHPYVVVFLMASGLFLALAALAMYRQPNEIRLDTDGKVHFVGPSFEKIIPIANVQKLSWWPRGTAVLRHTQGMIAFDWRFAGVQDFLDELQSVNPEIRVSKTLQDFAATWYSAPDDNADNVVRAVPGSRVVRPHSAINADRSANNGKDANLETND